ncbi:1,4-alpha-glucan branching protein [Spongiactinospora rosea]|uniref:1,4-alpha-glucan branching protein n=1 Tax=Spongiactinospora rosea TaxID=2248750 RepID=A0A366LTR3_9ACTN|nr:1,4-alpha-glucan branching protein [Spongiactinospora rosea]RBQ17346.1 1,4-alpha-glucan branching protein [Spongiactinospora rosea]
MAVIHHNTTIKPTKLELLTSWLPTRPWYSGGAGGPALGKAGGFRLDDPQGAVGVEFIVVNDTSGAAPATYLVPLTYRGAPLDGAEHALVGTMEHGVLGRRWIYDGCHDPVLLAELPALVGGRVQAQDQNISDALDPDVVRSCAGPAPEGFTTATDEPEATVLSAPTHGATLRVLRVLRPAVDGEPVPPAGALGHVAGAWDLPDGTRARGVFAVLYP